MPKYSIRISIGYNHFDAQLLSWVDAMKLIRQHVLAAKYTDSVVVTIKKQRPLPR